MSAASALAGVGTLARLGLRRDRIMLPSWIISIALLVISTASSFRDLYPTPESRQQFAGSVSQDPALTGLYGRVFDPSSIGGLTAWRIGVFGVVLAALMSLFVVVRHTRAEEEAGRLELVGAAVVGRHAALTAALLLAFGANLGLGAVIALFLVALGLPAAGSAAFGLCFVAVGMAFAAVAAVTAQLSSGARTARGLAVAVLGVSYLLRAIGDATTVGSGRGPGWLVWVSPIGWAEQARPFAGERWPVFGLAAAVVAALIGAAYALVTHRDLNAGLLPDRLGPAHAPRTLSGPFGLAWRLQRGSLAGWTVGMLVFGGLYGSVTKSVLDLVSGNERLKEILARMGGAKGAVDSYLATAMGLIALIVTVYTVQAVLRLRLEEAGQRAEPLLATGLRRWRWALSHLVFAVFGSGLLLFAAGLGAGLADQARGGDTGVSVGGMIGAALVHWPATLTLAGVALALFGLAPKASAASWGAFGVVLLLAELGPLLRLRQSVLDISPFSHVPKLPGGTLSAAPLLWLSGVAVALMAVGLVGLRRRDIG